MSAREAAAWRQADALAKANERVPVTVYVSRGQYLVVKRGDPVPPRAKALGTIEAPFDDPVHFRVYVDGRTEHGTIERRKA